MTLSKSIEYTSLFHMLLVNAGAEGENNTQWCWKAGQDLCACVPLQI